MGVDGLGLFLHRVGGGCVRISGIRVLGLFLHHVVVEHLAALAHVVAEDGVRHHLGHIRQHPGSVTHDAQNGIIKGNGLGQGAKSSRKAVNQIHCVVEQATDNLKALLIVHGGLALPAFLGLVNGLSDGDTHLDTLQDGRDTGKNSSRDSGSALIHIRHAAHHVFHILNIAGVSTDSTGPGSRVHGARQLIIDGIQSIGPAGKGLLNRILCRAGDGLELFLGNGFPGQLDLLFLFQIGCTVNGLALGLELAPVLHVLLLSDQSLQRRATLLPDDLFAGFLLFRFPDPLFCGT